MIHGMGEQRPLDTLNRFIVAALPPDEKGKQEFYSRPDPVTDSFESRLYLAPPLHDEDGTEVHAQTEFFEYHWAHLMQGNRADDLWPTFRRVMLEHPKRVPKGLRVVWVLFWLLLIGGAALLFRGGLTIAKDESIPQALLRVILGGGALSVGLTYLVTKLLPRWITTSFVDVVRYLDTSPRSYEVRREIRKGMVDLLVNLHKRGYQRIVVVAHSLGAFIAYDGLAYLWAHPELLPGHHLATDMPDGLEEVESKASDLPDEMWAGGRSATDAQVRDYQSAQRRLWVGLRAQGNPWLVTDLITLGTPMYFTDRLFTRNLDEFKQRVQRGEFPTCPPQCEGTPGNNVNEMPRWFSWKNRAGGHELDPKAPFAVVRWTNMWFPAAAGFFGDWFGDRLGPLFGNGISDIRLHGNGWRRFIPGYAHAEYLLFPKDASTYSVTRVLRDTLELNSTEWLAPTISSAPPRKKREASAKGAS
jgi:hypothetical protein